MVTDDDAGALTPGELAARAARVRLVLTDCDGVLTDTGVYYSARGEELKRFSIRDGMGVERLRNDGVMTAIITREASGAVQQRAAKLKLPYHFSGIWDKQAHLPEILEQSGCSLEQLAFIGDDVNDLELLRTVGQAGLSGAPADALPDVRAAVHHVCRARGGRGAFRDFADWILKLREDRRRQP
jgi:3-deoxy-D-manno-octulosonate 8-phosphate phosphatase (KDO 8-P phosphatase)